MSIPVPQERQWPEARSAALPAGSARERDDDYAEVIICLNSRWRVITCCGGMQWILQHRDTARPHRGFWRGMHYLRSRNGLIRVCVEHAGDCDPSALAALTLLPLRFGGAS